MRITTISSSFASTVVAVATDCVAFAGIAVRSFLHLTSMHEPLGCWLERCQSQIARRWNQSGFNPVGDLNPGYKPGLLPRYGISTPVLCPVPSRTVAGRATRRG
jgi:hypothetical protein